MTCWPPHQLSSCLTGGTVLCPPCQANLVHSPMPCRELAGGSWQLLAASSPGKQEGHLLMYLCDTWLVPCPTWKRNWPWVWLMFPCIGVSSPLAWHCCSTTPSNWVKSEKWYAHLEHMTWSSHFLSLFFHFSNHLLVFSTQLGAAGYMKFLGSSPQLCNLTPSAWLHKAFANLQYNELVGGLNSLSGMHYLLWSAQNCHPQGNRWYHPPMWQVLWGWVLS